MSSANTKTALLAAQAARFCIVVLSSGRKAGQTHRYRTLVI
jgi:hypothetical protein